MKKNYSTKDSVQSAIPSITSELSNNSTSYFTVVEHRKTTEDTKSIALEAKERKNKKIMKNKKTKKKSVGTMKCVQYQL